MAGRKKFPAKATRKPVRQRGKSIKKLHELPVSRQLKFNSKTDMRPVKVFFQNEARFGRIDSAASCRIPKGGRAAAGSQIIRQYTYLYGAFCPETGEQFSMILPYANGVCMDIFMSEFSKVFEKYRVIMAMDNASRHSGYKDADNIVPLFQPAHSPELNPAGHIWHYIRENGGFRNKTFNSIEEVELQLADAVNTLLTDQNTVQSITGFHWIIKAL